MALTKIPKTTKTTPDPAKALLTTPTVGLPPTRTITLKSGESLTLRTPQDNLNAIINGTYLFRVLLYGRSGTGKSTMADSFPGKKGIVDTDSGGMVYLSDAEILSIPEDSTLSSAAPTAWEFCQAALEQFSQDPEVSVIVLDSFTTIADACLKFIMHAVNRVGQPPTFVEWSKQMELLKNYLFKAFSSGKSVISCFHEDMEKDELSGQTWCLPLITGKLAKKVPGFHDEVYHMEPKKSGKSVTYNILTKASGLYVAKSRLDRLVGLETEMPADFGLIHAKIRAKAAQKLS